MTRRGIRVLMASTFVAVSTLAPRTVVAAAASVTPAARTGGLVTAYGDGDAAVVDMAVGTGIVNAFAAGPAGSTIVFGVKNSTSPGYRTEIRLQRFTASGSLDETFGRGGRVVMPLEGAADGGGGTLAVDRTGNLITAALSSNSYAVVRFLGDGSVDPSFGASGRAEVDRGTVGGGDRILALFARDDDSYVLASSVGLFGFDHTGAPLPTFGVGGKVRVPANTSVTGAAIRSDGVILMSTLVRAADGSTSAFVDAVDENGSPFLGFGLFGRAAVNHGSRAIAVDDDDRALVLGDGVVQRLTREGTFDPAFGGAAGRALCGSLNQPLGIAADASRVVVAGGAGEAVTRFDASGTGRTCASAASLAPTRPFAGLPLLRADRPSTITMAGVSRAHSHGGFSPTLVLVDDTLHPVPTFGINGVAADNIGTGSSDLVEDAGRDSHDRLVVLTASGTDRGVLSDDGLFALARLQPDGRADLSFGGSGTLHIEELGPGPKLFVTPDDSIFALARSDNGPMIVKVTPSGALDPLFGDHGVAGPIAGLTDANWITVRNGVVAVGGALADGSSVPPTATGRIALLDPVTGSPLLAAAGGTVTVPGIVTVHAVELLAGRVYGVGTATGTDIADRIACRLLVTGLPCPDVGGGTGDVVLAHRSIAALEVVGSELLARDLGRLLWFDPTLHEVATAEPPADSLPGGYGWDMAVDVDGSVSVVSIEYAARSFTVTHYLPHGGLDHSFGDDGSRTDGPTDLVQGDRVAAVATSTGRLAIVRGAPDVRVEELDLAHPSAFPTVSIGDASAPESTGTISFPVTIDPPSPVPIHITFTLTPLTATSDDVAGSIGNELYVPAGQTTAMVSFPVADDRSPEPNETFQINIASAYPAAIDRGTATGTILNDHDQTLPTARFVAVNPTRLLDTRAPGQVGYSGPKPTAGANVRIVVRGTNGVPADATAVAVSLTATQPAGPGWLTAYPTGTPRPIASNLNVDFAGQTIANLAIVPIGGDGSITLYTSTATHLVADLAGYYQPATTSHAGREVALNPRRILDTRPGPSQLNYTGDIPGPSQPVALDVGARGDVPKNGASAVILNLTATGATGPGYVTVWPAGEPRPLTSNLNLTYPGQTIAVAVIAPSVKTHLVVDVVGYFTMENAALSDSGLYVPVSPKRVLDTRPATRTPPSAQMNPANGTTIVAFDGSAVPGTQNAAAVVINLTVTQPTSRGYVTAYPSDRPRPLASTINVDYAGQTIANLATVTTSTNHTISLYSTAPTHLVADVSGYYLR